MAGPRKHVRLAAPDAAAPLKVTQLCEADRRGVVRLLLDLAALSHQKADLGRQLEEERITKAEYERQVVHLHALANTLSEQQRTAQDSAYQLRDKCKVAVKLAKRSQEQLRDKCKVAVKLAKRSQEQLRALEGERTALLRQQSAHRDTIEQLMAEVLALRQHIDFLALPAANATGSPATAVAPLAAADLVAAAEGEGEDGGAGLAEERALQRRLRALRHRLQRKQGQLAALMQLETQLLPSRPASTADRDPPHAAVPEGRDRSPVSSSPAPVAGPPQTPSSQTGDADLRDDALLARARALVKEYTARSAGVEAAGPPLRTPPPSPPSPTSATVLLAPAPSRGTHPAATADDAPFTWGGVCESRLTTEACTQTAATDPIVTTGGSAAAQPTSAARWTVGSVPATSAPGPGRATPGAAVQPVPHRPSSSSSSSSAPRRPLPAPTPPPDLPPSPAALVPQPRRPSPSPSPPSTSPSPSNSSSAPSSASLPLALSDEERRFLWERVQQHVQQLQLSIAALDTPQRDPGPADKSLAGSPGSGTLQTPRQDLPALGDSPTAYSVLLSSTDPGSGASPADAALRQQEAARSVAQEHLADQLERQVLRVRAGMADPGSAGSPRQGPTIVAALLPQFVMSPPPVPFPSHQPVPVTLIASPPEAPRHPQAPPVYWLDATVPPGPPPLPIGPPLVAPADRTAAHPAAPAGDGGGRWQVAQHAEQLAFLNAQLQATPRAALAASPAASASSGSSLLRADRAGGPRRSASASPLPSSIGTGDAASARSSPLGDGWAHALPGSARASSSLGRRSPAASSSSASPASTAPTSSPAGPRISVSFAQSPGSLALSPTSTTSPTPVPSHPLQHTTLDSAAAAPEDELERSLITALQSSFRSAARDGGGRASPPPACTARSAVAPLALPRHPALDDPHVTAAVARLVSSMQAEDQVGSATPSSVWSSATGATEEPEELRRVSAQTRRAEDVLLSALQGLCTAVDRCLG